MTQHPWATRDHQSTLTTLRARTRAMTAPCWCHPWRPLPLFRRFHSPRCPKHLPALLNRTRCSLPGSRILGQEAARREARWRLSLAEKRSLLLRCWTPSLPLGTQSQQSAHKGARTTVQTGRRAHGIGVRACAAGTDIKAQMHAPRAKRVQALTLAATFMSSPLIRGAAIN